MNIKTDELIQKLSNSDQGKRKPFSPVILCLTIFILVLLGYLALMSLRTPLIFNSFDRHLLVELFLGTIVIISLLFSAIKGLIPNSNRLYPFIIGILSLFFLVSVKYYHSQTLSINYHIRYYCEFEAFGLSVLTIIGLHFFIKKFPLFDYQVMPKVIFIITPMIASLILHSSCSYELWHAVECHVLPPLIPSALYLLTRKFILQK